MTTDELACFQVVGKRDDELDYTRDPEWIIDAGANVWLAPPAWASGASGAAKPTLRHQASSIPRPGSITGTRS